MIEKSSNFKGGTCFGTKSTRFIYRRTWICPVRLLKASVGLGNIWISLTWQPNTWRRRFLLVYIILALTFGYTMIIAEIMIGRSTQKSPCERLYFLQSFSPCQSGRMAQRDRLYSDLPLLFRYRRMGLQTFVRIPHNRYGHDHFRYIFYRFHHQRRFCRGLVLRIRSPQPGDYLHGR